MATKHVTSREDRLGVKLLHRTTLTEAGRRYLDTVEPIPAELEAANAAATAERADVSGTLRLNAPISFGVRVLATMLADLSARHPGLRIDLGLNDRVVDLVDEGWDAAVRIGRIADESLITRRLAPCRLAVAASPAYLAARGVPRTRWRHRSGREQGQAVECLRRHSLISRLGPRSPTPSRPAVSTGCMNRPDRRLHPTNAPERHILSCNAGAIHR